MLEAPSGELSGPAVAAQQGLIRLAGQLEALADQLSSLATALDQLAVELEKLDAMLREGMSAAEQAAQRHRKLLE